jgi:hypothetical protein
MNILNNFEINSLFNNKKISIVGNGNSTLNKSYGNIIDDSDFVIRFNYGGIEFENYKKDLGNNIDIFGTNGWDDKDHNKILNYIENLDDKKIVLLTRPINKELGHGLYVRKPYINLLKNSNKKIIEISSEYFIKNEYKKYHNFTTGLITILFLLDFKPKEIKLFGMDSFMLKNDYFFKNKKVKHNHNGNIEHEIINNLILNNKNIIKH